MNEFTDKEVAEVMRFHAEYGCYPRNATPGAVAMAKKLQEAAEAMMDPFEEEEEPS